MMSAAMKINRWNKQAIFGKVSSYLMLYRALWCGHGKRLLGILTLLLLRLELELEKREQERSQIRA